MGFQSFESRLSSFFVIIYFQSIWKKKHQRLIIGTERSVVIQFATLWLAEINLTAEQLETRL